LFPEPVLLSFVIRFQSIKMSQRILLLCGILASVFYLATNIYVPMEYPGYSVMDHTVSELSAIGAPTRQLWVILMVPYGLLALLFGWGVYIAGAGNRPLRLAGIFIILHALIGAFWPPMHTREVLAGGGGTVSDTLHIVWTVIVVPLMMLSIGFGGWNLGKSFRIYSFLTIAVLLTTGILTGIQSPDMEKNLPTPLMGLWERVSIVVYIIWVIAFALALLKREKLHESSAAAD